MSSILKLQTDIPNFHNILQITDEASRADSKMSTIRWTQVIFSVLHFDEKGIVWVS